MQPKIVLPTEMNSGTELSVDNCTNLFNFKVDFLKLSKTFRSLLQQRSEFLTQSRIDLKIVDQ